jgi:hypothetical protein
VAKKYVLDANVFIEASQRYYGFDFVPSFWKALIDQASAERIRSIDRVKQELLRGNDDLSKWADNEFAGYFDSTAEADAIQAYRQVMEWAQKEPQYTEAARAEFARVADGWLVAYAMARNKVLVTHEQFQRDAKKRILIPNACRAFGVPTVDTYDMLRSLGVKLG